MNNKIQNDEITKLYENWLGVDSYIKFDEYLKEKPILSSLAVSTEVSSSVPTIESPVTTQVMPVIVSSNQAGPESMYSSLENLAIKVANCTDCKLCESRNKTAFGSGNTNRPKIMFIGEGPGIEEDRTGEPFVGPAGQLLFAAIEKGLLMKREDLYFANVIKCRPPEDRAPLAQELEACRKYIDAQINFIKPQLIVTLGAPAAKVICDIKEGITKVRGTWMEYKGIKVMPTIHPAYVLRNPPAKKDFWEDFKLVLKEVTK